MSYQDCPAIRTALGIAEYAIEFEKWHAQCCGIGSHCALFHADACLCIRHFGDEHQRPKGSSARSLELSRRWGGDGFGDGTGFARESHLGQLFGRA